ncbi:hypothetical protein Cni_G15816 [Canna indica]|uniref:Uncharacterized protein n=1 Tax=Canna indica TaxID=4628 RepID=A0AAQ3QG60_9LILI|nr:hypothetical protein Cni_G15816 [Canna indica]
MNAWPLRHSCKHYMGTGTEAHQSAAAAGMIAVTAINLLQIIECLKPPCGRFLDHLPNTGKYTVFFLKRRTGRNAKHFDASKCLPLTILIRRIFQLSARAGVDSERHCCKHFEGTQKRWVEREEQEHL